MKSRIPKRKINDEETNPRLGELLIQVVENQMRDNTPPETKLTYERLRNNGDSDYEAKRKIAVVVTGHLYDAMHDNIPFDEQKYIRELSELK